MPDEPDKTQASDAAPGPPRRRRWRVLGIGVIVIALLLVAARVAMPSVLRWYVNRTVNQAVLYEGEIGDVDVHLWRGAYSIEDVRIDKVTGNVPVPLFAAERVDLSVQWNALLAGEIVGQILMIRPQLNFVDGEDQSEDQTGAGGPWLQIIQDLFPFRINSAIVQDGAIHFVAPAGREPVDVYLSDLQATVENLTNIHDETTPLITTVTATAKAMDQADFQYEMKLDPFSYRPTFQMAVRLVGLDVTKTNALARSYGDFDFEKGSFDLVIELDAKEGQLEGYVKPLFRDLRVLSLEQDIGENNILQVFWEALVGGASELLENQPRDQFGTVVPLTGDLTGPDTSLLTIIANVLRNAFIRAYLPRFHGAVADDIAPLEFGPARAFEP